MTIGSFDTCSGSTATGLNVALVWTFSTAVVGSSTVGGNTTCCGPFCNWTIGVKMFEDGSQLAHVTDFTIESTCTGNKNFIAVGAGNAADDKGGVNVVIHNKSSTVATSEHIIGSQVVLYNVTLPRASINATDQLTSYGDCP
jgi:hypothetical protein